MARLTPVLCNALANVGKRRRCSHTNGTNQEGWGVTSSPLVVSELRTERKHHSEVNHEETIGLFWALDKPHR
jgi:hypothetical protein